MCTLYLQHHLQRNKPQSFFDKKVSSNGPLIFCNFIIVIKFIAKGNHLTHTDPGLLAGTSLSDTGAQILSLFSALNGPLNAASNDVYVYLQIADPYISGFLKMYRFILIT